MESSSFGQRLQAILSHFGLNVNSFANSISTSGNIMSGQRISSIMSKEDVNPRMDLLAAILKAYPSIDSDWLITGQGAMLKKKVVSDPAAGKELLLVTVDAEGKEMPVYVDIKAQAGYLNGYSNPDYIQTLPAVSAPFLREKSYRLFQVSGESMEPTIFDKDILFAQRVYSPNDILNNKVYVIVTAGLREGIVAKRIIRHQGEDYMTLYSDNKFFEPVKLHLSEVLEMWYVRRRLTAQLPPPSNLEARVYELERAMFEIQQQLRNRGTIGLQ